MRMKRMPAEKNNKALALCRGTHQSFRKVVLHELKHSAQRSLIQAVPPHVSQVNKNTHLADAGFIVHGNVHNLICAVLNESDGLVKALVLNHVARGYHLGERKECQLR